MNPFSSVVAVGRLAARLLRAHVLLRLLARFAEQSVQKNLRDDLGDDIVKRNEIGEYGDLLLLRPGAIVIQGRLPPDTLRKPPVTSPCRPHPIQGERRKG